MHNGDAEHHSPWRFRHQRFLDSGHRKGTSLEVFPTVRLGQTTQPGTEREGLHMPPGRSHTIIGPANQHSTVTRYG